MQKKKWQTKELVSIAFLIALEIVLSRFVSINTPIVRIGFGFLPVAVCALLYGPWAAGAAYATGDLIGALLFPSGPFFPGFTLSAFLTGWVYGLFLYKKDVSIPRTLLACTVVMMGINLLLGTYWLTVLYGKSYLSLLPARIIKEAVLIPVAAVLILAVDRTALRSLGLKRSA